MRPRPIEFPDGGIDDGTIRLRLLREDDLPALVSALQGAEFGRWTRVPHPYGDSDARAWFTKQAEIRSAGTGIHLIVADARNDSLLGSVGLTEIDWEELRADIGYWVARESRRRGVATRSVRVLAQWTFQALPVQRLGILVDRENTASASVAERAGFTRECVLRSYTIIKDTRRDMVSYSLLPGELDGEPWPRGQYAEDMHEPAGSGREPQELNSRSAWLRCYRCWSQRLEAQVHYDAIIRIDPETGESSERVDEVSDSVVQCVDCMHDQPHLTVEDGRVVPVEDRWERMVAGIPWVASCTVTVDQDLVETCSGPEAADSLTFGAFGDSGTREFFTHVRFHKHEEERIVIHLLVELYARSGEEATDVLEAAARGTLELTSLAEESRPPAHASDEAH